MPLYDFHCEDCGLNFEGVVAAHARVPCEACNSKNVLKRISFPGSYKINGDNSASTTPRQRYYNVPEREQ